MNMPAQLSTCLVFGGCGWTGSFLVATLTRLTDTLGISSVHVADIHPPSTLFQDLHHDVIYHECDIMSTAEVIRTVDLVNPTVVFHLASMIDLRAHPSPFIEKVNVGGTEHIIDALRERAASARRYLVYTSTIDVVSGTWGADNADEATPYSDENPSNDYKRTKIIAEKTVLSADSEDLRTVVLRPGHIYGPGDSILRHVLKSPVGLGPKTSLMSFVYVQNCALCHVLAAIALIKESTKSEDFCLSKIRGSAFFVTDFDMNFSDAYCRLGGKKEVLLRLPWWFVLCIVFIVEVFEHCTYFLFGMSFQHPVTGISRGILEACDNLTAQSNRARELLGYNNDAFIFRNEYDGEVVKTIKLVSFEDSVSITHKFFETGMVYYL